jgi:tRNA U34 5-carboxymethylaminomethyl modifying GTPase MnmE/TrmE
VIDSSDVVVQVLDARDPMGTRCYQVEKYMKKEKPHKHLMFVLNKVDLIPVWVTVSIHMCTFEGIINGLIILNVSTTCKGLIFYDLVSQFLNIHLNL